jgi:hypothetical protein
MFQELSRLFRDMDEAYGQAAAAHGFICGGCEDNCCRTRFYHYTLNEYVYLRIGLSQLPQPDQQRIYSKAQQAVNEMDAADQQGLSVKTMCPLNENERCRLYGYRPMICRLHGIPHQLLRPDGQRQVGPGCGDFDRRCGMSGRIFLDRTPLYAGLADLERRIRRKLGFEGKLRMTIAHILTQKIDGLPDIAFPRSFPFPATPGQDLP